MSSAFVKESDAEWLEELSPAMPALLRYLVKENNGVRVYKKREYVNDEGIKVHEMSNGFSYFIKNNTWNMMDDEQV